MSREDLIARLARLDARDRSWLLGELPPALRRELIEELSEDPIDATPEPSAGAGWESLAPELVAGVLETEPAWLASAATRGTDVRWRERLLQAMTSRRRQEIELADRAGKQLNARAARLMLSGCRERILSGVAPGLKATARNSFAGLLDQMRGRFA